MQPIFDAVVFAGHNPAKPDALALHTGQPNKALVPIHGRPMVAYVVGALAQSPRVRDIMVVGMSEADGVDFGAPVSFLPDQGSLIDNVFYALHNLTERDPADRHIVFVMADMPLLTGDMVTWFLDACRPWDKDVYYGVVERQVMEQAFPGSRRTYLHLAEGDLCSGDILAVRLAAAAHAHGPMRELIAHRKNIVRQARLFGLRNVLRLLLRRLRLADALAILERAINVTGQAVPLPFAEPGMDVDKPHQLEIVAGYMERHAATYLAPTLPDGRNA